MCIVHCTHYQIFLQKTWNRMCPRIFNYNVWCTDDQIMTLNLGWARAAARWTETSVSLCSCWSWCWSLQRRVIGASSHRRPTLCLYVRPHNGKLASFCLIWHLCPRYPAPAPGYWLYSPPSSSAWPTGKYLRDPSQNWDYAPATSEGGQKMNKCCLSNTICNNISRRQPKVRA